MNNDRIRIQKFKKTILDFYKERGRDLPWRPPSLKLRRDKKTLDPYKILVSEMMLQQTQVSRVIPKYTEFLKHFPTFGILAKAPLAEVLKTWQGLGYNRRAKYLHQTAQKITSDYGGILPANLVLLQELPGIGSGTAGALLAFAFNMPVVFIETNIRSVFIHEFFTNDPVASLHDRILMQYIEKTLDRKNTREWYYALMDYGAMLKATISNPSRRSAHHSTQSRFEGSNRQIRGAIIRALTQKPTINRAELAQLIDFPLQRIKMNLIQLTKEGLIVSVSGRYRLA